MQQSNNNCRRHPQNTITHVCTQVQCHLRLLCQQCIDENQTHVHKAMDKDQLLVKLGNEINYQKYQKSLEAQFEQQTMNVRQFKRVMNKLCEQFKEFHESIQQKRSYYQDHQLNEMKQEFEKLKTGNLSDLHYHKLKFSEDQDNIQIQNFWNTKTILQKINQEMEQANKTLEQILNYKVTDQKDKPKKEVTEDLFYQNCKKMCEEIEYMGDNYYSVLESFKSSWGIEKGIQCWIGQNCQSEMCKEMKYDLGVNDLFEILSSRFSLDIATNILEDILDYK
ncbi:hypothetical protein pb186bvf_005835 [Paramecium bursaria]